MLNLNSSQSISAIKGKDLEYRALPCKVCGEASIASLGFGKTSEDNLFHFCESHFPVGTIGPEETCEFCEALVLERGYTVLEEGPTVSVVGMKCLDCDAKVFNLQNGTWRDDALSLLKDRYPKISTQSGGRLTYMKCQIPPHMPEVKAPSSLKDVLPQLWTYGAMSHALVEFDLDFCLLKRFDSKQEVRVSTLELMAVNKEVSFVGYNKKLHFYSGSSENFRRDTGRAMSMVSVETGERVHIGLQEMWKVQANARGGLSLLGSEGSYTIRENLSKLPRLSYLTETSPIFIEQEAFFIETPTQLYTCAQLKTPDEEFALILDEYRGDDLVTVDYSSFFNVTAMSDGTAPYQGRSILVKAAGRLMQMTRAKKLGKTLSVADVIKVGDFFKKEGILYKVEEVEESSVRMSWKVEGIIQDNEEDPIESRIWVHPTTLLRHYVRIKMEPVVLALLEYEED